MRKIIHLNAAALAAAFVMSAAGPAAADSSACTHHFDGPQVCIRLEGVNGWNAPTGIWTNPPRDVRTRTVYLYVNGKLDSTATATRVGKTLSFSWNSMEGTDVKYCVRFQGSDRTACEYSRYIGDRAQF